MDSFGEIVGVCIMAVVTRLIALAVRDTVVYWYWKFRNRNAHSN